ncbi:MAG: hypothetical protein AAGJ91_01015 [Pseudomonadota bacterium]
MIWPMRQQRGAPAGTGSSKAKRRWSFRAKGRGLTLIATFFLISALIRVAESLGSNLTEGWTQRAAWAQTAPSGTGMDAGGTAGPTAEPDALIAALLERKAALDARAAILDERQHALDLAEEELRDGIAAFEAAEAALRETLALADGAAQADLDRLTRMYETMKPKDAAALFATMDPAFAAGFLGQMSPAAAAEILAGLPPETAYSVSLVLAGRNLRVPVE